MIVFIITFIFAFVIGCCTFAGIGNKEMSKEKGISKEERTEYKIEYAFAVAAGVVACILFVLFLCMCV